MVKMEIKGLLMDPVSNMPVVILRDAENGLFLPIWVGTSEASAIAYAQQGVVPPRPLTHDLMKDLITAFGRRLEEVRIIAIRDNVFPAEPAFDGGLTGGRSSGRSRVSMPNYSKAEPEA